MAMQTKDKYITPKTEVLELQTKGVVLVGSGGTDPFIPEDI